MPPQNSSPPNCARTSGRRNTHASAATQALSTKIAGKSIPVMLQITMAVRAVAMAREGVKLAKPKTFRAASEKSGPLDPTVLPDAPAESAAA